VDPTDVEATLIFDSDSGFVEFTTSVPIFGLQHFDLSPNEDATINYSCMGEILIADLTCTDGEGVQTTAEDVGFRPDVDFECGDRVTLEFILPCAVTLTVSE